MSDYGVYVHGHGEQNTVDDGLIALSVTVHVERYGTRGQPTEADRTDGHRLYFHPGEEGWGLVNHKLVGGDGFRIPTNEPSVATGTRDYEILKEVHEEAVQFLVGEGFDMAEA